MAKIAYDFDGVIANDGVAIKDAVKYFKQLYTSDEHMVFIITSSTMCDIDDLVVETAFIKTYMPFFDMDRYIVCDFKNLITGMDFIIDEDPATINSFHASNTTAICFNQPWNKDKLVPFTFAVDAHKEIPELIDGIINGNDKIMKKYLTNVRALAAENQDV